MEEEANRRALRERAYAMKSIMQRASITTSDWNGAECC
jgi:hypothetical protein